MSKLDKLDVIITLGFTLASVVLMSMVMWQIGLTFIMLIVLHEFGHYLLARKEGTYQGIKIGHGLVCVKLNKPYSSRWGYLSGLAGSLLFYPFVLYLLPFLPFWGYPAFCLGFSVLDFVVFFGYSRVVGEQNGDE